MDISSTNRMVTSGLLGIDTGGWGDVLNAGKGILEDINDVYSMVTTFQDILDNAGDWRVRLSLPSWAAFKVGSFGLGGPLSPLEETGGLVFPYTPTITINGRSNYDAIPTTHTNYTFRGYRNSDPGNIVITAPMNVEDSEQAKYWIAAVHYLRSMTKMFTGGSQIPIFGDVVDMKEGNPPPIVFLNGYGNYVFKNIPVVVESFNITLDNNCDYIPCEAESNMLETIESVGGVLGAIGDAFSGASDLLSQGGSFGSLSVGGPSISGMLSVDSIASTVSSVTDVVGGLVSSGGSEVTSFLLQSTPQTSYVPTKSTFNITLLPVYSRTNSRNFSLSTFVAGGYANNIPGYA